MKNPAAMGFMCQLNDYTINKIKFFAARNSNPNIYP